MPCYDGRDSPRSVRDETAAIYRDKVNQLEAMLCGLMNALGPDGRRQALATFDEKSTGVSRKAVLAWFNAHVAADGKPKRHA